MSKDTKQNEKKDFTDSSWFIFCSCFGGGSY